MKGLFKTVVLITFFSVLTRILGFAFRIYLSRVVGAEALGMYQAAVSIFAVLNTIVASGIPLIISRMGASFYAQKDKKSVYALVSTALIFGTLISLILTGIVFLFHSAFAGIFTDTSCVIILLVLAPSLIASSVYSVFRGALWGKNNYFALCVSELFEQIVRIIICVFIVGSTLSALTNAVNVALSLTIASFASMILVAILYFVYGGRLAKPQKKIFMPLLKQSTPITGIRVASSFVQPLIAAIIPARMMAIGYSSSQAMALYGVAVGMTLPLLFIPTTIIGSLSTALIPDLSAAKASGNSAYIKSRTRNCVIFALFISAIFVPAFLGVGQIAGQFLYGNELSGTLLENACWVLVPMGLTNISSAILNSMGYEKISFLNYCLGGVFMFVALWFLPSLMGINALVTSMGVSYIVTAITNLHSLKKRTGVKLQLAKPIILLSIITLPSAALAAFIAQIIDLYLPKILALLCGGIVATVSFILLAMVFNIVDIHSFIVLAKKRIKKKKGASSGA